MGRGLLGNPDVLEFVNSLKDTSDRHPECVEHTICYGVKWHAAFDMAVAGIDPRGSVTLREAIAQTAADSTSTVDMVKAPPHYRKGSIECIDAIRSALGDEGFIAHCRAAAIKYAWRGPHKGSSAQDYRKAAWYMERAAEAAEGKPLNLEG